MKSEDIVTGRPPNSSLGYSRIKDLRGQRFGRLSVIEMAARKPVKWRCVCDCGNAINVIAASLSCGNTKSCGCMRVEDIVARSLKHGDSRKSGAHQLYSCWQNMKNRCYNQNLEGYANYGARGVVVCEQWLGDYASFKKWALSNGFEDGLTIDRIDVNGIYEPSNCRWIPKPIQAQENNRHIRPVVRSDGEYYPRETAAAAALGVRQTLVSNVLNGRQKTTRGYTFRFATPEEIGEKK